MNRSLILIVISFLIVLVSGCDSVDKGETSRKSPIQPSVIEQEKSLADSAKKIGDTSKSIEKKADKIDDYTNNIVTSASQDFREQIDPQVEGIKQETSGLRDDSKTLAIVSEELNKTQKELSKKEEQIKVYANYTDKVETDKTKLLARIKELESSNLKLIKDMLAWLTVACVVGIGACLLLGFLFKTPSAYLAAGGLLLTMVLSIGISVYLQYIAWLSAVIIGLSLVAVLVYIGFEISKRNKAVAEVVHTGEIAKQYLPESERKKIFGSEVEPGIANQVQSPSTQLLVRKIRSMEKSKRGFGLASSLSSDGSVNSVKDSTSTKK